MLPLGIVAALILTLSCRQWSYNRTKNFPKSFQSVTINDKINVWVFIMAGQSNMAGRAFVEPQDTLPSNRVLALNKSGEVVVAKEPIHFYEPDKNGLDCGLSFGKSLVGSLPRHIRVLLIPTAVGGSSIEQWLNNSTIKNVQLLSNFREKVKVGQQYGKIKGILWHQGESDANEYDIPRYKKKLSLLMHKFREISGNDTLPILIGELGRFTKYTNNWRTINQIINQFAQNDSNMAVVASNGLADKGDNLHFNSESQRILGKRYAQQYIKNFVPKALTKKHGNAK
jgi:hypothetical protein